MNFVFIINLCTSRDFFFSGASSPRLSGPIPGPLPPRPGMPSPQVQPPHMPPPVSSQQQQQQLQQQSQHHLPPSSHVQSQIPPPNPNQLAGQMAGMHINGQPQVKKFKNNVY